MALQYSKDKNHYSAIFYGCAAALRENPNGLIIFMNEWMQLYYNHCNADHKGFVEDGGYDYTISLRLFIWNSIFNSGGISQFDDLFSKLSDLHNESGDNLYAEYTEKIKRQKKERRKQLWANIGMALLSCATQVGSQYLSYQPGTQPTGPNVNYNLNTLLDPRLAMMQVQTQNISEYNSFCYYNKKADGSNYSYDEWMNMKAQAYALTQNSMNDTNNTQSSSIGKKDKTHKTSCSLCKGTGRIAKDTNPAQFRINNGKEKCQECGEWFPASWGHTHVTCPVCHGHN